MSLPQKLAALRGQMATLTLDAFLVPRTDEYQNEYVPACAERLAWLTGFTGSAGTAVVLATKAALFVDGRYTLQAPQETDTNLFTVKPIVTEPLVEWLVGELPKGSRVGIDARLFTQDWVESAEKKLKAAGLMLIALGENPIDAVWTDRPAPPCAAFKVQPDEFTGESSQSKRLKLAEKLKEAGQDAFILTAPDSIAWLLNIRGGDVPHTPLPLSFGILHSDGQVDLFADECKVTDEVRRHLGNSVRLHAPESFAQALTEQGNAKKLTADPSISSHWVFTTTPNITRLADPCVLPKACKNSAELNGTRAAHLRDGAAVASLLASIKAGDDEMALMARLRNLRAKGAYFRDLSFETIAGSGPNGAIVHYRSTDKTNRKLQPGELFLLDSGGQYQDGTTDITRTIAIGTPTPEMRDRFTRVLKGHIAIATAVFPKGTTGHQLDALARYALWQAGLDYDHGTGHGVGSFLSVHEGPQRIASKPTPLGTLQVGMILSNEPGYYKTGAYGIRCENLVVVQPVTIPGGEREMLGFETITLCPFDRHLIDLSLLNTAERDWLNAYHHRVHTALTPQVDAPTRSWLDAACAPL